MKTLIKTFSGMLMLMALPLQAGEYDADNVVKQANQKWNQAFNQADAQALAALYADDASLSPGNGAILRGHNEIAGLFQGFFDNGVHNHRIEAVDVIASGKQITQIGHWQAEGQDETKNTISFGGVLVTVLKQNDQGEWKVQSHVWNMAP
ncbi:MAG: SgcJ/EcaC family oxidoreductase [Gammaproteobacteria bacterium]|nr:SgcJ/EcaC family oxidoreductase [Gammaproteobacteria bacterium]